MNRCGLVSPGSVLRILNCLNWGLNAGKHDLLMADSRTTWRGWMQPMVPKIPRFSASEIFGNCVAFPHVVAPQTITAWFAAMALWISAHLLAIRSIPLKLGCGSRSWQCFTLALES